MALKILLKKGLSNKTKTPPEIDHGGGEHTGNTEYDHCTPEPFIDRISLVWEPKNESDAHSIHANIWTQTQDTEVFKSCWAAGKTAAGFKRAWNLLIPGASTGVLFQYRYAESKATKFRLDFSPANIGISGMSVVHAALTSIVPSGWSYVIELARITRLDIALDVPNARMDQFQFLAHQGMWSKEWGVDGHLQTFNLGKPKGNYTQIYNKKAEQLAKCKAWEGKSVVRVERRLRNPKIKKLAELGGMENPFAMLTMIENMPPAPAWEKPREWARFEDSVRARGVTAALALLSEGKRTQYRKHLMSHPHPWWDVHAIWANWQKYLQDFPLADHGAFK